MQIIRKGKIFPNLTHHHGFRAAQTLTKSTEMKRQYSESPKFQLRFFSLEICEAGKQTIPIPTGLAEDGGGAMGLLWPFQIKKFPPRPFSPLHHILCNLETLGAWKFFGGLDVIFEILRWPRCMIIHIYIVGTY